MSPAPDPAHRSIRRRLLLELYGIQADATAASIDHLVDSFPAVAGGPAAAESVTWSERDLWLIAYPDQVTATNRDALVALADLIGGPLAPLVTGVHVLPFHPSTSDGGFSVADYDQVDPRFGSWDHLAALAERVDLMVDAVVNHTSASHPWFVGFLAGDPDRAGWYRTPVVGGDLSAVVRPRTTPLVTTFEPPTGDPVDVWTTFSADQVDLDVRSPAVVVALTEVLLRYAATGASAIRLDAIGYLAKQEGTSCIHLPDTHRIVQVWRSVLAEVAPRLMLVTETNVPHAENLSYLGDGSVAEADVVYQFALPPLVLHTVLSGDPTAFVDWSPQAATPWPGTTTFSFLASHDGVGLRPIEALVDRAAVEELASLALRAGGVVNRYLHHSGEERAYELASTWFDLMAEGVGLEVGLDRHIAAHALMLAMPGIPLVYVHSLFASSNDIATFAGTGHGRDLNRARFESGELARLLGDPSSRARRCLDRLGSLAGARRSSSAFHPEAPHRVSIPAPRVILIERAGFGGERALVWVEVAGQTTTVSVPEGDWVELAADRRRFAGEVELGPYGSIWLGSSQ